MPRGGASPRAACRSRRCRFRAGTLFDALSALGVSIDAQLARTRDASVEQQAQLDSQRIAQARADAAESEGPCLGAIRNFPEASAFGGAPANAWRSSSGADALHRQRLR